MSFFYCLADKQLEASSSASAHSRTDKTVTNLEATSSQSRTAAAAVQDHDGIQARAL